MVSPACRPNGFGERARSVRQSELRQELQQKHLERHQRDSRNEPVFRRLQPGCLIRHLVAWALAAVLQFCGGDVRGDQREACRAAQANVRPPFALRDEGVPFPASESLAFPDGATDVMVHRAGADGYNFLHDSTFGSSPCLTSLVVSPCGARAEFWISHYIVVSSSGGAVGGRWSLSFRALRTRRARGEPGVVPLRSLPSMRNCTCRIVLIASRAD